MPTPPITRRFSLLTTGFPHGAYQSQDANKPDLRAPSVKGQLRWWFDALIGKKTAEDSLFGGLKLPKPGGKPGPQSSRVIIRVRPIGEVPTHQARFIPHKLNHNGQYSGGHKHGILPGTQYEVTLLPKREGWKVDESRQLERIVDTWILLGAIGQRSNRAGGSIWPEEPPADKESFSDAAQQLLGNSRLRVAVLNPSFDSEEALRFAAGDFLAADAFQSSMTPFGSARPRKPSLLRLKAVHLDGALHLLALWDGRFQAANTLEKGIGQLAKSKDIGKMLEAAIPKLCR